jgi:LmbE family N-acetylglucosaminyl deacetylase
MGDEVRCVILGEGQTSRGEKREDTSKRVIENLHRDTLNAASVLGYSKVYFAEFPDNRFDHVDLLDIVKYTEKIIDEYKPDIIYTHHEGDLNIDHKITYRAVLTATRPVNNYTVKELYTFETVSSSEWYFQHSNQFRPNVFIDIENSFEKKILALQCYSTELCEYPHPRSIKGLEIQAQKWGIIVGKHLAEAFFLVRKVV